MLRILCRSEKDKKVCSIYNIFHLYMHSYLMMSKRGDWWKKCIQRKAPPEWTKSACAMYWSLQHEQLDATSVMQLVSRVLTKCENFNIVTRVKKFSRFSLSLFILLNFKIVIIFKILSAIELYKKTRQKIIQTL